MSTHRGVSCDRCGKSGFTGLRYKCLLCFDFDLCADCYNSLGDDTASNGRHTSSHPVQCILTRSDRSLYYGDNSSYYSFTCPFCALPGHTEQTLHDHVNTQHAEQRTEVVCPICAALPDGDANFVTDDFPEHLAVEHQIARDTERLVRRIHQRGGRMKGYHRLYPSSGAYQPPVLSGNSGSLFGSGYLPRKERASGFSQQHGGESDPLADLLSQLTTSHRDNTQLQAAALPHMDSLSEDKFQQMAKQYTEYSKYSFNQFSEKPPASETRNAFHYKPLTDTHTGKGGKDRTREGKGELTQSVAPHREMTAQMRELSKASEEEKEAFDLKRAEQSAFLTELLISSLSEDFDPDYKWGNDTMDDV